MKGKKGFLYVVLFSVFWSVNIILAKIGFLRGIDPFTFSFQMYFIASIILILYSISFKLKYFKAVNKKNIWKLILTGIIGSGLGTMFGYLGLKLSTSVNYGFIIKTTIIFTVILSFLFLKEKLSWYKILLSISLLFGAYLISTGGLSLIPHIGDFLIVVGALFYSISNIITKTLSRKIHPDILTMFRAVFAAFIISFFVVVVNPEFYILKYPLLMFSVGIVTAVLLIFLNRAIHATTISYMTMMSMITPVFVAVMGILILSENINLFQIIGGLLIIISGIFISRTDIQVA